MSPELLGHRPYRRPDRRLDANALGIWGTVVNLDCDTKYNGVNNCDVTLQDVHFTGLSKKEQETGMVCKGVKGTATVRPQSLSSENRAADPPRARGGLQGLTGLNNCLKEAR